MTRVLSSDLRQGGDRRSHRIEVWSGVLLAAIEARADISLVELAEKLAALTVAERVKVCNAW